jgi:hypothetical protein
MSGGWRLIVAREEGQGGIVSRGRRRGASRRDRSEVGRGGER